MRARNNTGYSLVEVLIAASILLLLMANVAMVTRAGKSAAQSGVFHMSLDDELNLTVERISFAVMAADSDDVDGAGAAPITTETIEFSSTLGLSDGTVVRGPVEEIAWLPTTDEDGRIVWREQPTTPEERTVNWSSAVPHVGQNEIDGNGADDNDNGVQDEKGLGFTKLGGFVSVYVTVERMNGKGKRVPKSTVNHVTCRN